MLFVQAGAFGKSFGPFSNYQEAVAFTKRYGEADPLCGEFTVADLMPPLQVRINALRNIFLDTTFDYQILLMDRKSNLHKAVLGVEKGAGCESMIEVMLDNIKECKIIITATLVGETQISHAIDVDTLP